MAADGRRNEDAAAADRETPDDGIAAPRSSQASAPMSADLPNTAVVEQEILACLPHLRAFARSLAGDRDRADDLVQDAILRALGAADQFEPGSNFKAWIFTILRNLYFNEFRRNPSLFRPLEAADMEIHATSPAQHAGLEFDDFRRAFNKLPPEQREALVLVGADGFKYEEAAAICGCAVGTIKSRVSRARRDLQALLGEAPRSEEGEGAGDEESQPAKKW
jgi:RNA polymerase sigma-70 factor, ECF subfamily